MRFVGYIDTDTSGHHTGMPVYIYVPNVLIDKTYI